MLVRSLIQSIMGDARIGLVDIGASGGLESRWRPFSRFITPFFFEPDHRALEKLASESGCANPRIFPFALTEADGSVTLNLCVKQTVSSVFKPNLEYLRRFPDVERFEIVAEVEVPARALDSCLSPEEMLTVDFFKIDTQGCELRGLQGARKTLTAPVIGLEVEVEFQELYENQPLFGEVCSELKAHGFELFDFTGISRWNRNGYSRFGQLAFADALFMRPPESFVGLVAGMSPEARREKYLKYIAVCGLYHRVDLMAVALEMFSDALTPADRNAIAKSVRRFERRQYLISRLSGALFRFILKPLGLNFLPFSYSAPSIADSRSSCAPVFQVDLPGKATF
jgi:FkbM family methyltransferase